MIPADRAKWRTLLNTISEPEFHTLCFDNFPDVEKLFTTGQDRSQRILILLQYVISHDQEGVLEQGIRDVNLEAFQKTFPTASRLKTTVKKAPATKKGTAAKAVTKSTTAKKSSKSIKSSPNNSPVDVLIVAANPKGTDPLTLELEADLIKNCNTDSNKPFTVRAELAANPDQLSSLLMKYNPRVLHFAGHGTKQGNLIFENADGESQIVSTIELGKLLGLTKERLECVVLNACWSAEQAEIIARRVRCVVGMSSEIDDESARKFAVGFYEGLAFGRDYPTAVELGRSKIGINNLPHQAVPQFLTYDLQLFDPEKGTSQISRKTMRRTRSGESEIHVVELWYGTNRKLFNSSKPELGYSAVHDNKINYGKCSVVVPKSHRPRGKLASPFWWRLLTWTDDRVKLDWKSISPSTSKNFWSSMKSQLSAAPEDGKEILVFVHGFRVSFEDAAIRTAQISADIGFPGLSAFFSWPSFGTLTGYVADGETIIGTLPYLKEFLTRIVADTGATRVHLVVHSMGNRGVLHSLSEVIKQVQQDKKKLFGQIILAAPDVALDTFEKLCQCYSTASERTTLYASPRDWAVWASSIVNWGKRVGYHPPIQVYPGIDTIRVNHIDMDWIGHGYVGTAKEVMSDMREAILLDAAPDKRGLLKRKASGRAFWEFRR